MNIPTIPFLRRAILSTPLLIVLFTAACLSSAIQLKAQTTPVFTVQPISQSVSAGSTVTFSVAATSTPAPTYRWRLNGFNLPAATGSSLTITGVTSYHVGNYTVEASSTSGGSTLYKTSQAAALSVVTIPSSAIVSFIVGDTGDWEYNPVASSEALASRFLIKASFGPNAASISGLLSKNYSDWIDEQLTMPASYHLPLVRSRANELVNRPAGGGGSDGYQAPRQEVWWQHAIMAPDQLRQRMAFALSQILVISQDSSLDDDNDAVTAYYDILVRNAFGNYRQLLEEVTLSPMMGTYLSMIRNQKPNVTTGQQPDENYAREIMQLFTIGLSELNLDGTLRLDSGGYPIPTYTQADIVGLAHVFTGWGPHYDPANPPKKTNGTNETTGNWFLYGWDPLRPMTFYTAYGDLQTRTILGGVTVPSTLTGPQRMTLALDTLFNNPNVGPFLARRLIQRFVTSNPTPAYISRVASKFNNNGSGVRGDLGAVIQAILLDSEAHLADPLASTQFGKLTEPLMRMTRIFRAFPPAPRPYAAQGDNRMFLNYRSSMPEQAPLFSPTVFNFFLPNFAKPGVIDSAGLVSPEFQIFDDVTSIQDVNRHYSIVYNNITVSEPAGASTNMKIDLAEPLAILTATGRTNAESQALLVEYYNQRLLGGLMSPFLRQKILDTYTSLPSSYSYSASNQLRRAQLGLYLVMFSPEFKIQR